MLELIQVSKSFAHGDTAVTALNQVSLHIRENAFVAIMGSSGSGKSTLMNVLGCLDTPSAGQYLFDGEDVAGFSDERLSQLRNNAIGFIFQTFHLLPKLSVLDNVMLPLRYGQVPSDEGKARALALIERVGLTHRIDHKPNEMSGGQRQRVAIARALVNQPRVILADEPTGNLDSRTSAEIMQLLTELHADGQTIVMVTHEPDIAEFAHQQVHMRDGQIEAQT